MNVQNFWHIINYEYQRSMGTQEKNDSTQK